MIKDAARDGPKTKYAEVATKGKPVTARASCVNVMLAAGKVLSRCLGLAYAAHFHIYITQKLKICINQKSALTGDARLEFQNA